MRTCEFKYGRFSARRGQKRTASSSGRLGGAGDFVRTRPRHFHRGVSRPLSLHRFRRFSTRLRGGRQAPADSRGLRADYAPAARAVGSAERALCRDHDRRRRGALEASIEEYRALYHYTDFDAFLRAFGAVGKRLRTPADYGLITRRLLERLEAQNVRYAEIMIAAGA